LKQNKPESLESFLEREAKRLKLFDAYYRKMNEIDPENHPLIMDIEMTGAWDEMYEQFYGEKMKQAADLEHTVD
jgi:hypothetical protein